MQGIWIVLVILWWVISAVARANKKQQSGQQQPGRNPAQRAAAQSSARAPQKPAAAKPAAAKPQPARPAPQPLAPAHEARPLEAHMHTPVMGLEGVGTEGEDCCHEYMLTDRQEDAPADILPLTEEKENERAKALLQGVIFSEILGRRTARRYGVKRT